MTVLFLSSIRGSGEPVPSFRNLWHITTVPKSNDQGQWFGWVYTFSRKLDAENPLEKAQYFVGRDLALAWKEGRAGAEIDEIGDGGPAPQDDGTI